jgi:hypothetical protein
MYSERGVLVPALHQQTLLDALKQSGWKPAR